MVTYVRTEVKSCDMKTGGHEKAFLNTTHVLAAAGSERGHWQTSVSLPCCQGKRDPCTPHLKGHSPWPNTTPGFKMKEHRGTLSLVQEWRCCTSFVSCTASSDWDRLELPCEKRPDLALKTSKSDFNFLIKKELSPSFLGRFTQTNNHIYNWKIYIFPPQKWTPSVSATSSSLCETFLSGRLENLH